VAAVWGQGSAVVALTVGAPGHILRSTNGGASWEVVEGVEGVDHLCDLECDLAGVGSTLVAVNGTDILVSNDLGITWSHEPSGSDHALIAVSMPDPRTVVAGGAGVIIRGRR
jgi:photosystem II stability/assembly factor-like uncharacterized protein